MKGGIAQQGERSTDNREIPGSTPGVATTLKGLKMEFGKALQYDIKISTSSNKGFIVKVGCCTCIFSNKENLLSALKEYLDDPET